MFIKFLVNVGMSSISLLGLCFTENISDITRIGERLLLDEIYKM